MLIYATAAFIILLMVVFTGKLLALAGKLGAWIAAPVNSPFYAMSLLLMGLVAAQTFPRDSQVIATQVARSSPDSLWQQQMTELMGFMRSQQLIEARRVYDREDVLRRLTLLETIHPDALAIQIASLEKKTDALEASLSRISQMVSALLLAVLAAMFTSWLNSRKK